MIYIFSWTEEENQLQYTQGWTEAGAHAPTRTRAPAQN